MKDRRIIKTFLPRNILEEFGAEVARVLMEEFLVLEADYGLARDGIEYIVWHPQAKESPVGMLIPEHSWVFTHTRSGNTQGLEALLTVSPDYQIIRKMKFHKTMEVSAA